MDKENLTFEEKKYYIDKMMEVIEKASAKDTEGKQFNWKVLFGGATLVVLVAGVGTALLQKNGTFHLPGKKS